MARCMRVGIVAVMVLGIVISACNPLDDDDATATPAATATREVSVATFTPTEVVPPEGMTATAEAQATGAAQTATEEALNPEPTVTFANPTVPPEDLLTPPTATLEGPAGTIPASPGSYFWVFGDDPPQGIEITAPIVQFEHEPVTVERGQEFAIALTGRELRAMPESMDGGVYNFEDNSAYPTTQQGQTTDELAFVVNADPDQALTLDPAEPRFTTDVPPGHYGIRIQGFWPPHPGQPSKPIFVTWVFNVIVT